MADWKPAVIDEYMESLLKRGVFRQTMNERLAKVRSGEESEALARVDSYMTGFLSHEWRKASRKKVGSGRGAGIYFYDIGSSSLCDSWRSSSGEDVRQPTLARESSRRGVVWWHPTAQGPRLLDGDMLIFR